MYNLDEIEKQLRAGKGWSAIARNRIANPDQRDRRNLQRWHDRETKKNLPKNRAVRQIHGDEDTGKNSKGKNKDKNAVMSEYGSIRRTKYGSLEPTDIKSELSHIDWMRRQFGHDIYKWDLPYLTALQDLVWDGDEQIGHSPRYGGKTVTYLGITPRELVERFEPVLTVCSPKRVKVLFRSMIRRMYSPQLRLDYGDILAVEEGRIQIDRTEKMMWISDEIPYYYEDPLFRVASQETDIIGSHPTHIHLEDISQQETENITKKIIEWYEDVLLPMTSMEYKVPARKTATSTRKGPFDFDNYLMTKQGWSNTKTHFKAIEGYIPNRKDVTLNEYGSVIAIKQEAIDKMRILNPAWSPLKLMNIAFKTPITWASQYQNVPIPRGGVYFTKDDIHKTNLDMGLFDPRQEYSDPAWGTSSKKKTVILISSVYNYNLYILDASIGKFDTNVIEAETVRLARQWGTIKTKLEDNYAQYRSRFDPNSMIMNLKGVQLFQQDKNKLKRISALKGPMSTARIRIHEQSSFKDDIIGEILSYDESNKAWDILDTIAMAYEDNARWMRPTPRSKIQIGVQSRRFDYE